MKYNVEIKKKKKKEGKEGFCMAFILYSFIDFIIQFGF